MRNIDGAVSQGGTVPVVKAESNLDRGGWLARYIAAGWACSSPVMFGAVGMNGTKLKRGNYGPCLRTVLCFPQGRGKGRACHDGDVSKLVELGSSPTSAFVFRNPHPNTFELKARTQ